MIMHGQMADHATCGVQKTIYAGNLSEIPGSANNFADYKNLIADAFLYSLRCSLFLSQLEQYRLR